jgi:aminomethyltransferase
MTLGTAFHVRTSALNQKLAWEDWSGYFAASVYADYHDIEYSAIRDQVAAIDVSPLYKYMVSGPDAMRLVDRVIARDATKQQVGQVYYAVWCDERGKVVDDGTITRVEDAVYRWTAAEPSLRWLELNAERLDVTIDDVTDDVAALAIQGPNARLLLERVTNEDWSGVRYYRERRATIAGIDVDVTRTGYTGDLGYELWVPQEGALDVWDALFDAGPDYGLRPAGTRALDVVRIEAGLILIDAEYTGSRQAVSPEQEYSPFEIGLGRLVNFEKAQFVGRSALLAEQEAGGPPRRLVGVTYDYSDIASAFGAHGLPVTLLPESSSERVPLSRRGKRAGRITSSTWSPILKRMIAFGSVRTELAAEGTRFELEWNVEGWRHIVGATVVPLPFLDLARKRA